MGFVVTPDFLDAKDESVNYVIDVCGIVRGEYAKTGILEISITAVWNMWHVAKECGGILYAEKIKVGEAFLNDVYRLYTDYDNGYLQSPARKFIW